jgi:FkbM family methyltransferase
MKHKPAYNKEENKMEKGSLLWRIKDVMKWRRKYIGFGFHVLSSAPGDVSLWERFRFFVAKLRVLLPIPDRYMERRAEMFALGLRLVSENDKEEIYERKGLFYAVPRGKISRLCYLIAYIELLAQYREPPVIVEEGDIVIDCGAFIGVTSLLFAERAGKTGKVIAIEPQGNNYNLLQNTAKLNEGKVAPIIPLKVAVYKENCELELYISNNPLLSASHTLYKNIEHKTIRESLIGLSESVKAVKIDTLVEQLGLERVDFIKMDIEGAEVDALIGAEKTISQFKPKLAICTYHRPTDPIEIREILSKYNPNYKFKEIERGEKVLFVWDEARLGKNRF